MLATDFIGDTFIADEISADLRVITTHFLGPSLNPEVTGTVPAHTGVTSMTIKIWQAGGVLLAGGLAAACTTMGVGTGLTRGGGSPVDFTWSSDNSTSGTMTAKLEKTGQSFDGKFFQVTSPTRIDDVQPLFIGWHRRWSDWPYWGPDYGSSFATHYSGRVLANLTSTDGEHMRCSFRLVHPMSGMAGGGQGRCQVPDGKTIDTTFPAA